jgi:hypothetical protein
MKVARARRGRCVVVLGRVLGVCEVRGETHTRECGEDEGIRGLGYWSAGERREGEARRSDYDESRLITRPRANAIDERK